MDTSGRQTSLMLLPLGLYLAISQLCLDDGTESSKILAIGITLLIVSMWKWVVPIASVFWAAFCYLSPSDPYWALDSIQPRDEEREWIMLMQAQEQHDLDREWLFHHYPGQYVAYAGKQRIGPYVEYHDLLVEVNEQCYDMNSLVVARITPHWDQPSL